jgi:uncharacterized membrane protein SpoIIM required for sporulation
VHLAQVGSRSRDVRLLKYLNDLAASAHGLIYLPPRRSVLAGFSHFVTEGFARSLARNWRAHALSAALFLGGACAAYWLALGDPQAAYALWPAGDERQPGSTQEQLLTFLRHGRDESGSGKFLFASFLFQHNLKVGLLALATGLLAAVPTVVLMIYNGMILGVFAAIHHRAGINSEMWAWILPHGVTELLAVIVCGGVGLMLGGAVVNPGLMTRREALGRTAREAGTVTLGAAGMLLVAAILESYLRQSHLSTEARLLVAGGTAVFWTLFLVHGFIREKGATAAVRSATAGRGFADREID